MPDFVHKPVRIYALIDFSAYAPVLVRYAHTLSQAWRCEVTFVHQTITAVPALADDDSKQHIMLVQQREALDRLKALVSTEVLMLHAHFQVTDKELVQWLLDLDHVQYHNWVLTGLKGTGTLQQIFVGSTTNQIIEHTDLPVIALPLLRQVAYPKKIALGMHHKHPINMPVCRQMLEHLRIHSPYLTFFTIITKEEEEAAATTYLREVAAAFPEWEINTRVYRGVQPMEQMKAMMLAQPHTVLMLQQGARSLTDLLFRRFMINDLVYDGNIPLIVIPKS